MRCFPQVELLLGTVGDGAKETIYIGFGSMREMGIHTAAEWADLHRRILDAVVRAVTYVWTWSPICTHILPAQEELDANVILHNVAPLGDQGSLGGGVRCESRGQGRGHVCIVEGFMPLRHVFARCSVVVHHGGAGTVQEALRAGVPQVICPFAFDQHHWAERLAWLGLGVPCPQLLSDLDSGEALGPERQKGGFVSDNESRSNTATTTAAIRTTNEGDGDNEGKDAALGPGVGGTTKVSEAQGNREASRALVDAIRTAGAKAMR
jgi:hypothetical protein